MLKITILHHVLSSPSTGISHASAAALRSAALLTGGPTRFGWERWAELAVQWAKSWGFHGTLTCGVNVDYIKWLAYDSRHVVDVFFFSGASPFLINQYSWPPLRGWYGCHHIEKWPHCGPSKKDPVASKLLSISYYLPYPYYPTFQTQKTWSALDYICRWYTMLCAIKYAHEITESRPITLIISYISRLYHHFYIIIFDG